MEICFLVQGSALEPYRVVTIVFTSTVTDQSNLLNLF